MSAKQEPFQHVVNLTLASGTPRIAPPPGQRIVIEYINVSGSVANGPGPVQPLVVLNVGLRATNLLPYYFYLQQSALQKDQYFFSGMTALHAEEIFVAAGFAGPTPASLTLSVALSGFFMDM